MLAELLDIEEKERVIECLQAALPKMTKRQLECFLLNLMGFTQEESGEVLNVSQPVISEHLRIVWFVLGENSE